MTIITVLASVAGKFGPQLQDSQGYLSFGKFYKGDTNFPVGTVLEVDLFTTAKGNRYINSAKVVESAPVAVSVPIVKRGRKASAVTESKPDSKPDWDEIGRGKTASLFVEALLSNPNVTQSLDSIDLDAMDEKVWQLVDLVFKTRKENA